jgi:hypothetical protein
MIISSLISRVTSKATSSLMRLRRLILFRLLIVALVCVSTLTLSSSPRQIHAKPARPVSKTKLDLNALRNQGKALYKKRDYRGAELFFIKLVQHNSTNAKDYTFLARSAMRAQDFPVASVAYLIYFELTRKPKAKLRDEYKEVSKNLDKGMDKRKLKAYHNRLEEVLHLIKDHQMSGKKGALAAIDDLHRARIFHPLMNRAHQRFKSQLFEDHERLVSQLLNGDQGSVATHQKLLKQWGSRSWGDHDQAQRALNTLKALAQIKSRPEVVLTGISELERQGVKLPKDRLRQLQLNALITLNRAEEVYMMADGLIQDASVDQDSPETQKRLQLLHLLRGIYGQKLTPEARADTLVEMMSIPSPRARRALKLEESIQTP